MLQCTESAWMLYGAAAAWGYTLYHMLNALLHVQRWHPL